MEDKTRNTNVKPPFAAVNIQASVKASTDQSSSYLTVKTHHYSRIIALCKSLLWVLSAVLFSGAASASYACISNSATIEQVVACQVTPEYYGGNDSDKFVIPKDAQMTEWRTVVASMMDGSLDGTCPNGALRNLTIDAGYAINKFTEANSRNRYCILYEVWSVSSANKLGWGTFITSLNDPEKELIIAPPHVTNDNGGTDEQSIAVFKNNQARVYMMPGASRYTSNTLSTCQGHLSDDYFVSDVAHNTQTMFHAATVELKQWYDNNNLDDMAMIQFHGMAASTCPVDVYATYGRLPGGSWPGQPQPGDWLHTMNNVMPLYNPNWLFQVPDPNNDVCSLHGSTNVQGRFLNGISNDIDPDTEQAFVCYDHAHGYSGQFIHIEQKAAMQDASLWHDVIDASIP